MTSPGPETITAYPLAWPFGRPRTPAGQRKASRFDISTGYYGGRITPGRIREALVSELRRLRATSVVISTNVPLRRDGLPYSTGSSREAREDPGVAVYFTLRGRQLCMACDRWRSVDENLWAVVKTIEAIRGVERWGSGDMVEQAFTGFAALPPPKPTAAPWWEVLGLPGPGVTREAIDSAWRKLAMKNHPDRGGRPEVMAAINRARDEGLAACT